jgi:hypothetical protein
MSWLWPKGRDERLKSISGTVGPDLLSASGKMPGMAAANLVHFSDAHEIDDIIRMVESLWAHSPRLAALIVTPALESGKEHWIPGQARNDVREVVDTPPQAAG